MAAAKAIGKTRIINAACEPEIVDLQNYMIAAGFDISGAGTSVIEIVGNTDDTPIDGIFEYRVMPDRIVAQTYLIAAAMTGGYIKINSINPMDIFIGIPVLQ